MRTISLLSNWIKWKPIGLEYSITNCVVYHLYLWFYYYFFVLSLQYICLSNVKWTGRMVLIFLVQGWVDSISLTMLHLVPLSDYVLCKVSAALNCLDQHLTSFDRKRIVSWCGISSPESNYVEIFSFLTVHKKKAKKKISN